MASTLADFLASGTAEANDWIVGYDTTVLGGERRWNLSTIANTVSAIMTPALQNLVTQQTITLSAPTGIVAYFAATSVVSPTAPSGWTIANGFAVTTALGSSYTPLRNLLISSGNPFGVSGSDPLAPDLRGIFIRGNGSQTINSITYNKTFANKEGDTFQGHQHSTSGNVTSSGSTARYEVGALIDIFSLSVLNPSTDGVNGTPRTSSETRPANITLLPCIKL